MKRLISLLVTVCAAATFAGCGAMHDYYNMAMAKNLKAGPADETPTEPEEPVTPSPLFSFGLGNPVSPLSISDQDLLNDYDGDMISNNEERITNPFVAEYPKIVTRIDTPISVEIRSDSTSTSDNFSETITGSEIRDTLSNSMEDKQYTQANLKTTPVPTKESRSDSSSESESWGVSDSVSTSSGSGAGLSIPDVGGFNANSSESASTSHSENGSTANSLASAKSCETTVFKDVDYVDNLDRSGVEINSAKVKTMTGSFRNSEVAKNNTTIGPSAGIVSSCLHIHNLSVNYPVRISDVKCTLSFRTPSGQCQAVRTFTLRNDDFSVFSEEIYGDEEKGPYAIVIDGLNTDFIRKALSNGWVPQMHVVSYTTSKVKDSNYDPGVENLKIVEEKAKGRTALISIKGQGVKDSYRVSAFDVQPNGSFVPGISLKKAIFNIMADRIGSGEKWASDIHGKELTVSDSNLKWMKGGPSEYAYGGNTEGNSWRTFETYVKQYTDDTGKTCRIETVKRLFALRKYNPFDPSDNSSYNVSELMSNAEIEQMQFWMIYHDGKYFQGDLNDPIWPGERYELICVNIGDFNQHFKDYYYTPFQSSASVPFNTRWNSLTNDGEFARSRYLGQVIPNDIIHLKVGLVKTRNLFLNSLDSQSWPGSGGDVMPSYTFAATSSDPNGVPKCFSHTAKGGTNSIAVVIEPSENAADYSVTINGPVSKTIRIHYDVLEKNGNTVFIDRNTSGVDGTVIASGTYTVKAAAYGTAYGTLVSTASSSNSGCVVKVEDPSSMPSGFSVSADGYNRQMTVCIGNSSKAEYFDCIIMGPMNYPGVSTVQPVKMHSGYNYLSVPVPDADALYNSKQHGLFRIQVTAQNSVSMRPGALAGAATEMYVEIPYDMYAVQKDSSMRPVVSSALEKRGAVDLEVNFNDGNGWFALQTSGSDADFSGMQTIDCRFTSFIDYKAQVFDLYFAPPSGSSGKTPSGFNAFSGGRMVADVYLRTRANPCYRDTFWPRKSSALRLSSTSVSSVYDLVRNLLLNRSYDATCIESRSQCAVSGSDPRLSAAGAAADFFFSPMLERSYSICAELTNSFPGNPAAIPDTPKGAVATSQKNAILVEDITAGDETKTFRVYYKAGISASTAEDIAGTWLEAAEPSSSGATDSLGTHVTIGGLTKNKPYMIAVYGFNEGKLSAPLIRGPVYPYGAVSSEIPSFTLNVQASMRNALYVGALRIDGESRYQVQIKKNTGGSSSWVLGYDTYDVAARPLPYTGTVSVLLKNLVYSTAYQVRVRAVSFTWGSNGNLEVGPWSETLEVSTLDPSGVKPVFSLSVPSSPGTSVLLSGLQIDGENRYQIWYKPAYPATDDDLTSTWTKFDSYADGIADYGDFVQLFERLGYWKRYVFKARSANLDATAVMSGRTNDEDSQYVGTWSDPLEIVTSNCGSCAAALSIESVNTNPGALHVMALPMDLATNAVSATTYDVTVYVSFSYGGAYQFANSYANGSPENFETRYLTGGDANATYSVTGLKTIGSGFVIPRVTTSIDLSTAVNCGYAPSKPYADFVTSTQIMGYKCTFHNVDPCIPDFDVINGTTW